MPPTCPAALRDAVRSTGPAGADPVVRFREHYRDPDAPPPGGFLPVAFAVVRDPTGAVLLVRRADDGNWELPGGRIELGESAAQAVVREVAEESGIRIGLTGIAGVYSDPAHLIVDTDGRVRQQLAVCFHAAPLGARTDREPRPDGAETTGAAWFEPGWTDGLTMHPAVRLRLRNAVTAPGAPHFD